MHWATASGARSMRAPSASSTSAEPDRPVAERLPCLATVQPAPAAISAAVVDTLNVGARRRCPRCRAGRRGDRRPGRKRTHRARQPGQLVDRLSLRPQRDQERRDLDLRGVAGHDLRSTAAASSSVEVAARRERVDRPRERSNRRSSRSRQEVAEQLAALLGEDRLGVELDPSAGSSRWRTPITTSPPNALRSSTSVARARRRASGSGRRRAGSRRPRKIVLPSCSIAVVLPWTGSWRTTLPPNACASAWWPRQTPSAGLPPGTGGRPRARCRPRSGVQGPGRDDDAVRAADPAAHRRSRRRCARPRAPRPARRGTGRGCR